MKAMTRNTKIGRRGFLAGLAASATFQPAWAQQFPTQDIFFVCAFPGGSSSDTIVRFMAERVRPLAGRTIIVENRFGASGNIAAEHVLRSKPDGHTIFVHAGSALAANMHLFKKPPFDAAKEVQVAGTIHRQAFMMVIDSKRAWKSLADLTAHLKEKADKATYATYASTATVMGELYKQATGTQAVEVAYRVGADSLNDLASGAVDYAIYDPVFATSQAREGRIRILGVSTGQRMQALPDIPTMTELGAPMDLVGWFGAMVPIATPRPVVETINGWFRKVIATDEAKAFLNRFGGDPWVATVDEAQAQLLKDVQDWREYVRIAKITPQG
jgi:tripartite-type tricarboxylate transporter receptor subunit TctC